MDTNYDVQYSLLFFTKYFLVVFELHLALSFGEGCSHRSLLVLNVKSSRNGCSYLKQPPVSPGGGNASLNVHCGTVSPKPRRHRLWQTPVSVTL